jgi:hypothetical protein
MQPEPQTEAKRTEGVTRRSFLRRSGAGTGVAIVGSTAGMAILNGKAKAASWMLPDTSPETPDSHEISTLKAMTDTYIPNWDGDPGGREADAFTTINDPHYGLNPYISEVVSDLDAWTTCWYGLFCIGPDFDELSNSDKDESLEYRMGLHGSFWESLYMDAYEGILSLTKLAFFGGLHNSVGTNYVAFPGESAGYHPTSAAGAFHSDDTPKAIPDNNSTGITSWVYVSGSGTVSELKVSVDIKHTYRGDLEVDIYAPNGTYTRIHNNSGGSANDLVINDLDVTAHNGKTAQGWWRCTVRDIYGADTGTLNFWSFKLRTNLDDQA